MRDHENEALRKQDITHAPTIGDMYEGLTQSLLDTALPAQSEIGVTAGFITNGGSNLSDELDCMVVLGEGEEIPYTNKRKYLIDDVVAVIQVKKNLYSSDLRSGYENLASVRDFVPTRDRRVELLQDAFQGIMRRPLPSPQSLHALPWEVRHIYTTLLMELVYPARIIFGYNGFKNMSALRHSFSNFLDDKIKDPPIPGYGVPDLPSLVCCGRHCLVKNNGMPYYSAIEDDGYWPVLGSTTANPVELLLQVIWTRLVYDNRLPPGVFDDDVYRQRLMRFLDAQPARQDGRSGWLYRIKDRPVSYVNGIQPERLRWQPTYLDHTQFIVMSELCLYGQVDVTTDDFEGFLVENGYTIDSLVKSLNSAGLAARDANILVLLTRGCQCAILPDGQFVAAENIAGQLTRWLEEFMRERRVDEES